MTKQTNKMTCAPREDSAKPGNPSSLIGFVSVRMKKPLVLSSEVLSFLLSAQQKLIKMRGYTVWCESSLAHMSFCWFCRALIRSDLEIASFGITNFHFICLPHVSILIGPRQANLVLIAYASSEGSGETARMRRLAWTFAARIGDKYQIRLTRSNYYSWIRSPANLLV